MIYQFSVMEEIMIKIRFGTIEDTIVDVDGFFDVVYEKDWLNDPIVKEMVLDIDKSIVISQECIDSPVLGQIPPTELSGGVKALILMLKTDEEIWATACGNNCAKWILEIAKQKDIKISLEHFLNFKGEANNFSFQDLESGIVYDSYWKEVLRRKI